MTRARWVHALFALCALAACGRSGVPPAQTLTLSPLPQACDATAPSLAAAKPPAAREALLAATTDSTPHALVLYDLSTQRVRWRQSVDAQTRPELLADVVVSNADGFVLAFDTQTGAMRMRFRAPLPVLIGSAQLGSRVFVVTSSAPSRDVAASSTLTAFDLERGQVAWTRELHDVSGKPQLAADRVLVLLAHRDLRVFDAADGRDLSCTRLGASDGDPGHASDWLRVTEAGVFFGDTHARLLSAPGATPLSLPLAVRPTPAFFEPDDAPVPGSRSAHGRVALVATLGASGAPVPTPQLQRFFFVFYRALFAYRGDGTLLWARVLDADVARAVSTSSHLLVALDTGLVQRFDLASGAATPLGALGERIASADLWSPDPAGSALTADPAAAPPALQSVLAALASNTDSRLLPARELAVDALAAADAPSATCDLLDVYNARAVPDALRERVAERLRARSLGMQCFLDALGQHGDFLEGTAPPPLAAIVPALVAQHETRALPQLIAHLFDPQTASEQLAPLVDAIDALGGSDGKAALERFRALYHADSVLGREPLALSLVARALEGSAKSAANASASAAPVVATHATPAPAPTLPDAPDEAGVRAVMAQHAPELQSCVQQELARNAELRNVRLGFVVTRDGAAHALQILPSSAALDACVRAKIYAYKFPSSRDGSRPLTYLLAARARVPAPTPAHPPVAPPQFWALSQARAAGSANAGNTVAPPEPWWTNQNPLFLSVEPQQAAATAARTSTPAATRPVQPATETPQPSVATPVPAAPDAWWLPVQPADKKH